MTALFEKERDTNPRTDSGNRREEDELQVSMKKNMQMYNDTKYKLDGQVEYIDKLKENLTEAENQLNREIGRARYLNALNKNIGKEVDEITLAKVERHKESQRMEELMEAKDKEIESLLAQVNLLMQVTEEKQRRKGNGTDEAERTEWKL
mmetsp:Transcript_27305/g.40312  ORF Transcript_27305/g.40312 Transcript_27305/m.40312 type:complete len:150 (-) Transcript_27305:71-520(-)